MDARKEIKRYFSWVPPPSTVITINGTDARHQQFEKGERIRIADKPENGGEVYGKQGGYKFRDLWLESNLKNRDLNNFTSNGEIDGIELLQRDEEDRYKTEPEKSNKAPKLILEEAVEAKTIEVAEIGIEFFGDDLIERGTLMEDDPTWPPQLPTRKDSGSEHYRIGKQAVDVGNLMRSRKKSELNPSQKFLSLSFQNAEDSDPEVCNDDVCELGAAYLKRLNPDRSGRMGQQSGARTEVSMDKRGSNKEACKRREEKLQMGSEKKQEQGFKNINSKTRIKEAPEKEHVPLNENDESEYVIARKKSVFMQDIIDNKPIDVQEILNRKKSTVSLKEKFLSMSIEQDSEHSSTNDAIPSPVTPLGGFYAKRVSNRK